MKLASNEKLYTLYWLDGKREVVVGTSIANAFARAGYFGGALAALDWYDAGATDTHVYSCTEKTWIIRPKRVKCSDLEALTPESIALVLSKALGLDFELPYKNQICIDVSIGEYAAATWVKRPHGEEFQTGCARSIRVYIANYCEGPYSDDSDEECHYEVSGTSWFDPKDIDQAIFHFQQTIKAHVDRDRGSSSLEAFRTFLTAPVTGITTIEQLIENQSINDL
jgi:hypothetical protein